MSNVFYRPFVDENNERYWVFFEHGRIHAPILVLDEYTAMRFAEQVMALYEPPEAFTEAMDDFDNGEDCTSLNGHTWLEDLLLDGDIVIADHVCKHCSRLGMQDDDDPLETVYPTNFLCSKCQRPFSSHFPSGLTCPYCQYENVPF